VNPVGSDPSFLPNLSTSFTISLCAQNFSSQHTRAHTHTPTHTQVATLQFNGLDCIRISGGSFLRADTSVDCETNSYRVFKALNIFLIAIYQSIPLIWCKHPTTPHACTRTTCKTTCWKQALFVGSAT